MKLFDPPVRYYLLVAAAFIAGCVVDATTVELAHQATTWSIAAGMLALLFGVSPGKPFDRRFATLSTAGYVALALRLDYGPEVWTLALTVFALILLASAYADLCLAAPAATSEDT